MKFLKISLIMLGVVALVAIIITSIIAVNYFLLDVVYDVNGYCADVLNVDNDNIEVEIYTSATATGFERYEYRIDDDKLYITIICRLDTRGFEQFNRIITINDDFSNINEIYIEDRYNRKLIWQKGEENYIDTQQKCHLMTHCAI